MGYATDRTARKRVEYAHDRIDTVLERVTALEGMAAMTVAAEGAAEGAMLRTASVALREIVALPCECARMNAFAEFRQTREVVRSDGKTHHWLGCHVALAARGLGGRTA